LKTTLPVGCLVALEPSREPFGSAGERRKSRRQLSIVVGNNGTCIIEADAQFVTQRVDSAAWLVAPTPRKASRSDRRMRTRRDPTRIAASCPR